jgi:hypothetical protein
MQCVTHDCKYFCFKNSKQCSEHVDNTIFDSINQPLYVNKDIIIKKFDILISDKIINKNQEKHLINLKKLLKTNNFYDIIKIYITYLKCINKKYITSYLAKDLMDYCNITKKYSNIHYLYSLVGDYWNIDKNHNGVARCYYGDNYMLENSRFPEQKLLLGPRLPHKTFLTPKCIYYSEKINKVFQMLEE